MLKKQFYEAPDAELFEVRFEENIMSPNTPGSGYGDNDMGDLDDDPNN